MLQYASDTDRGQPPVHFFACRPVIVDENGRRRNEEWIMATIGDKGAGEKKTAKPAPKNMALMAAQKRAAAISERKPPRIAGAAQWLREARAELKKTTWPTR